MSDATGWTPPPPPGSPQPGGIPPGPPPAGQPPGIPPAGPPPAYQEAPGPSWGTPYAPPRSTNTLAVVSLVAGCAQFVICPVIGAIVAIVTGHIARRQIRDTGEQGNGLAVAGLILGYIGAALTALAIVGALVVVFAFGDDIAAAAARDDAQEFGSAITREADFSATSLRDPELLQAVYSEETSSSGCCDDTTIRLANGAHVLSATDADWEASNWQLEFEFSFVESGYACLVIPESGTFTSDYKGRCDGS
jgi:hypothetical protein